MLNQSSSSLQTNDLLQKYANDGYVLIEQAIPPDALTIFENNFLSFVQQKCCHYFDSMCSNAITNYLLNNRDAEKSLYENIRSCDWLSSFCSGIYVTKHISNLLGQKHIDLLSKIVFRIDLPFVTRELAVWHQDYWYVQGNTDIVTAWIPICDTFYHHGCLLVMPGSHKLGILNHDQNLLKKRHMPSGIFQNVVKYVEMKRGDLLLFHSLFLHSSGLNISDCTRFSIQARFSRPDLPTSAAMGNRIHLTIDST